MEEDINEFVDSFIEAVKVYFGNRITDIKKESIVSEQGWHFSFTFRAYDYFDMRMNYDQGFFGWVICNGKRGYGIQCTVKQLEKDTFSVFMEEMKKGIELRIPDEYLEAKGWK